MGQSNPDYEIWEELRHAIMYEIGAPARDVHSFAKLLIEDRDSSLSAASRDYAKRIIAASERLEQSARDIGSFLYLKAHPSQIEECDVGMVVQSVCEELSSELTDVITTLPENFPIIHANRRQLAEVFRQLVYNAIDYNDKDEKHIELSWRKSGNAYEFVITDNGIGIAAPYHGRIFFLLDRLNFGIKPKHGHGTGAGLAICQAIVESHGGKIWVESAKGAGSSFHFTIPDTGAQAGERQNEQE